LKCANPVTIDKVTNFRLGFQMLLVTGVIITALLIPMTDKPIAIYTD